MDELLQHPVVKGALAGFLAAAYIDYLAFKSWKTAEEARAYKWDTAILRWAQGLIVGGVSASGLGFL